MNGLCSAHGCSLLARVLVTLVDSEHLQVCVPHWGDVLQDRATVVQSMRLIALPRCFLPRCRSNAVTIVRPEDGSSRPVCQRHLDNLSWLETPTEIPSHAGAGCDG